MVEVLPFALWNVAHDAIAVERRFETEQREKDRKWLLPLPEAGGVPSGSPPLRLVGTSPGSLTTSVA